jgi:hypothetical protein
VLIGPAAKAQTPMGESAVKAMFVYNFLKFVEWPSSAAPATGEAFVVCIIGEGETPDAVQHFLESKAIGDQRLVVRRARWDESLAGARAVFVLERDSKKLRHILDEAAAAGVLSIGEGDGFASRGGVIGLLVEDRKVRFDVDTSAAQNARLRVSSKLLALSRTVLSSASRPEPHE